jgi:hypothetical protein
MRNVPAVIYPFLCPISAHFKTEIRPYHNRAHRVEKLPWQQVDVSRFDAAPLIAFIAAKEMNYGTETEGLIPG